MKKIIAYLIFIGFLLAGLLTYHYHPSFPTWLKEYSLIYLCIIMGGLGGIVYCLRGVYLNACVKKTWDKEWHPWYYIRPLVSLVCGGISYLFLKAGLLVLESNQSVDSSNLGFLALAFIAGLNVDKFISKIEDVAQAAWGIEKSRASKGD
ncbi:MAG TPA: hypothetical protein ENH82_20365 [bacterium]|nr:hypothetical protein [bacterium]